MLFSWVGCKTIRPSPFAKSESKTTLYDELDEISLGRKLKNRVEEILIDYQ
jgi:hypothetical protein